MKSNFTRLSALFLSILLIATMFAACGKSGDEGTGEIPKVDLELPATSSSEPIYNPGEEETDPSTEGEPSTEVDPSSETDTEPSTEEQSAMAKTTNTVNLRDSGSTEGTILTQVPRGAIVTLLDTSDSEWYKISYNGNEGYVKAEYLTVSPADTSMELKGKVTAGSLNIRDAASSDGKSIGSLSKGDIVTIVATENGWYKIKNGSGFGYVSADYVSIVED